MKTRIVEFSCSREAATSLAGAVRAYADAAYPPSGSECAQVARETLHDAASHCAAHPGGMLQLRKRLMPQIRAALSWTTSEDNPERVELPPDLIALLRHRR